MLFKVLAILPIVSICVDGTASPKSKHAVSTQSYHRGDVPLSYKYTAVHIYTTPHPEQRKRENHHTFHGTSKHQTLQYAPIKTTYQNDNAQNQYIPDEEDGHVQITERDIQHSTEVHEKDHLEPRLEAENLDVHDQSYRSYVPGHNIEVLQSNRVLSLNDLYKAYHDKLQSQKVNLPKYNNIKKPEQYIRLTPESLNAAEQRPLSEEHNILYTFLPKPDLAQPNTHALKNPFTWRQALSAKIPRLHLNIARVYGIAHLTEQGPNRNEPIAKPPSHTQAIFRPLQAPGQPKTILYPVQDPNKNYPVVSI